MSGIDLKLSLVQTVLSWEDRKGNRNHIEKMLEDRKDDTDLILLPEMFPSGFTMRPAAVAETMDGETNIWMRRMAEKFGAALCGSVVIADNGTYRNRLLFVTPDGTVHHYDKRHLFTLAGEEKVYAAGKAKLIVEYRGWKICPLICYDLRFPVFSRNTESYDLLLYVANWPAPRIEAWDALLKARAIENMSYTAGVNRVGQDGNGHAYVGHSNVYDALGQALLPESETQEIRTVSLSREQLIATRTKFSFLDDRDQFTVM